MLVLAAGAAAATGRCIDAVATWRIRRQAIRRLGALDDRALKDLGIPRSEIESVVYFGRDWHRAAERKSTPPRFAPAFQRSKGRKE